MNWLGTLSVWLCLACVLTVALFQDSLSPVLMALLLAATVVSTLLVSLWTCGPARCVAGLWHAFVHRWHAAEGDRLFGRMLQWAADVRQEDESALSSIRRSERNAFARNGLELLSQHTNAVTLRLALEKDIRRDEDAALSAAEVFDTLASNTAVVGLVVGSVAAFVIFAIGEAASASWLPASIAFGFSVVTAVILSGTVFRPLASRLRARGVRRGHDQARSMNGMLAIWQRKHPERVRVALFGDRCSVEI